MNRKVLKYLAVVFLGLLCTACGSRTTVILLPDDTGKSGSVVVSTPKATQTIDKPYTYTTVGGPLARPAPLKTIAKEEVTKDFKEIFQAHPKKPISYTLYFITDSAVLTGESKGLIPEVLAAAKEREPSEISIIGHTDTQGSKKYNIDLSLKRAETVEELLLKSGANLKETSVESHGENDLLVLTPDNVSEPKNRRVEVMIR